MTADAIARLPQDSGAEQPAAIGDSYRRAPSLALRLLMMTLGFIMLTEAFIFLPSVGRAQQSYLEERLAFGHLAILALDAAPQGMVDGSMQNQLLTHAGADLVALRRDDGANRVLRTSTNFDVQRQLILPEISWFGSIGSALRTLFTEAEGQLRIVGTSPKEANAEVEVVVMAAPLKLYLSAFALRVLLLSLLISGVTAALIYISLLLLIVRPVKRLTRGMRLFAADPEDQRHDRHPSRRSDELGEAERQFASMRETVRQAFHQKSRLAALGTGLTKITHDLRNVMSTTILLSDGLEISEDPMVQRIAPRLSAEIGRAEALCLATVTFATEGPVQLELTKSDLAALVDAVVERLDGAQSAVSASFEQAPCPLLIDRPQLDRVFDNLVRNAQQMGATEIHIQQKRIDDDLVITVTDNGPGLPPRAREHLFAPFAGSARKGGTGLGLPLSRDLVRAHGGELELGYSSGESGTQFRVTLPGSKGS